MFREWFTMLSNPLRRSANPREKPGFLGIFRIFRATRGIPTTAKTSFIATARATTITTARKRLLLGYNPVLRTNNPRIGRRCEKQKNMNKLKRCLYVAGGLWVFWVSLTPAGAAEAKPLDFNRDIRPILSEHCFACHGFDEKARQGELRLDVAESALAPRDGKPALAPGKPEASELWKRITSGDDDLRMPPPKANLDLSAAEKEKLRLWIEQGAPFAGHWAFIPPAPPQLPPGDGQPIDRLVRARLAAEGLQPAPRASRETLIRRVTLDLTGLPPTAHEVQSFVADDDPKAYEKLVERLLRSPHFGERMALDWLDSARYADTNGFSIDGGRNLWLWRDWVIQSFNDNLPYDRFLIEQLAGDLLPNRTEAQLIATGFQRNNMVTHEGGTIPEENLANYNADRVKTLGEAVLGLTLGCAQCHDHKFDPITQRDYYRIFSYFNELSDKGLDGNSGINPGPSVTARTVLRVNEEPALREEIAHLREQLQRFSPDAFSAWEARQQALLAARGKNFRVHAVKLLKISTPNRGAGFEIERNEGGPDRVRIRGAGDLAAFDMALELPKLKEPITGVRAVFHPLPEFPGNGWGGGPASRQPRGGAKPEKGTFMLTALGVTPDTIPGDQVNLHKLQQLSRVTASSWEAAHPPKDCLNPRNETGWSPALSASGPVHLTATFAEPVQSAATPFLTVQLNFGHGRSLIPGLIELQVITGADDGTDLPVEVVAALGKKPAERSPEEQQLLWDYCAATSDEMARSRVTLANLEERLRVLTEPFPTMVMDRAAKPRETFILARGDYSKPTERVTPGVIAALPQPAEGSPANRLGLAQWLTQKNHPLTARVAVNRLWRICFGTGLVATPADFGSQGEWPSHPELLDWLAVDFVERGWDLKRTLRSIVLSETYQQSSHATAAQLERDPANRLLARGPRFRLSAELIRDAALQTSGLLVRRLGGPSVNPYTPGDLWREVSHYGSTPATAQTFVQDQGEKLYRRSLYTYWKRTAPPPNMTAFDAPNREVCTVSRSGTITPLQALVLLNDPQYVEAARAFAERILSQPGDDAAKLRWAWLAATSRQPSEKETAILAQALPRERARYQHSPTAAAQLLAVGESPRNSAIPPAEHAAWTQLALTLLNLSEVVMRN